MQNGVTYSGDILPCLDPRRAIRWRCWDWPGTDPQEKEEKADANPPSEAEQEGSHKHVLSSCVFRLGARTGPKKKSRIFCWIRADESKRRKFRQGIKKICATGKAVGESTDLYGTKPNDVWRCQYRTAHRQRAGAPAKPEGNVSEPGPTGGADPSISVDCLLTQRIISARFIAHFA